MLLSGLLGGRKSRNEESSSATNGVQQQPGAIGTVVRGIASGIGLASEAYHHHKQKNAQKARESQDGSSTTTQLAVPDDTSKQFAVSPQDIDEAAWQLDDAQQQVMGNEDPSPSASSGNRPEELAESFLQRYSAPPASGRNQQLALPVVITQKRPSKRTRGFIRAYAPILNDVGINEETFLEFIDDLNKAVLPNPWIQAINLASLAGMAAPEPFTVLISIAVQQVANAASTVHSRYKTNHFLNEVNKSYFMPRGLIALVMTWKPSQASETVTNVNTAMDPAITNAANESEQKSLRRKFAQSSGATAFEWPETAPLTFPALDDVAATDTKEKQNALKRTGSFVAAYMDSRSRAKWAGQNPDSKMANTGPKEQFHSRYSDPNHPASSGDPIALITGGHFQGFGGIRGALPQRFDRRGPIIGGGGVLGLGAGAVANIFEKVVET